MRVLQADVVFFQQLLFHSIIADKFFFVSLLLLGLVVRHQFSAKLGFTRCALPNRQIHLLFNLFFDTGLKCFQHFCTCNIP